MKPTPHQYLLDVSQISHCLACRGLAVLLLMAAAAPAWGQSQIVSSQVLEPTPEDRELSDPHVDVNFGAAVAVEGSTAAVGIPFVIVDDGYGPGRVGIYTKTEAGWIRTATLLPTNTSDIRFGSDVELCGNLAIVAAENSTYVFERSGALWRKIKRIGPPAPRRAVRGFACSGDSFALSIGTLDRTQDRVHVYERCGDDFRQVAWLRASDPNDKIGRSLAMERDILVAGSAPDGAYVFVRQGHRWIEREKLQSAGPGDASIGSAVAIRDRIIIAGAPRVEFPVCYFPSCGPEGDAFVYLPSRGSWFESQSLNNPPRPLVRGFGSQVAMGRALAAVVAPFNGDGVRPFSSVLAFDRIGAEFTLGRGVVGAGSDETIQDIDMSGRRLIVSVHERFEGPGSRIIGHAVIIEFEESPEPLTQTDKEEAAADSP